MSVRDKYFRETTCPACNLLPLESLSEGTVPGTTTIRLDKLDIASIESFAPKCDLYRLLADLSGHLKVNGREESMGYDGITYRSLCGRNEWRIRHTDLTHLSLSVDFDSILEKRVDDRYIHEDPLSDHGIRLIKHWMAKCERKHDECFDHPKDLPTRVIDITGETLKLLDPSPSGSHQYVALSHCWGTCRSFLTTRTNVEDRKRGFTIEELPATFQDAVKVTRALGLPYLWIDSICILQDDKDDWEIEGSKMADVYANATLAIAAANASDDAEGFIKPRKEEDPTLAVNICVSSNDGEEDFVSRVYTRLPPRTKLVFEPLDGRAWCLQERYLSPRIHFFTSDALRWECLGNGWFEAGRGLMKNKLMLPNVMPEILENGSLSHIPWYKMVELYTTRAISYPSDKLPALSALASRVAQKSGDTYLAGLWKSDLFQRLLWYRQVRRRFREREPAAPFQEPGSDQQDYLALTWSWASYPGAIQFEASTPSDRTFRILPSISVVDASVSVPGKNPFGQVESGFLLIRTPLLSFEPAEGGEVTLGAWEHNVMWCLEVMDYEVDVGSTLDYPEKDRSRNLLVVPLVSRECTDAALAGEDLQNGSDEHERWVEVHGILLRQPDQEE